MTTPNGTRRKSLERILQEAGATPNPRSEQEKDEVLRYWILCSRPDDPHVVPCIPPFSPVKLSVIIPQVNDHKVVQEEGNDIGLANNDSGMQSWGKDEVRFLSLILTTDMPLVCLPLPQDR